MDFLLNMLEMTILTCKQSLECIYHFKYFQNNQILNSPPVEVVGSCVCLFCCLFVCLFVCLFWGFFP